MRISGGVLSVVLAMVSVTVACGGGSGSGVFRQYEYEEEMYLSLDGRATVIVNGSIPALNRLRGTAFDLRPNARVDRDGVREYFSSPVTRVVRVSPFRRSGRQFVHVRLVVDDVRRLGETAPFGWSSYELDAADDLVAYRQTVGAPSGGAPELELGPTDVGRPDVGPVFRPGATEARNAIDAAHWTGDELVAFRIHIPSVVLYHNAGPDNLRRGNILVWEQPLDERLKGVPVMLEARMQPESILYRTLALFGAMFAAVALTFGLIVWQVMRAGKARK
jgi:hypothetical protein